MRAFLAMKENSIFDDRLRFSKLRSGVGYGNHHRATTDTEREIQGAKRHFFSLSLCLRWLCGDLRNTKRVVSFCPMKIAIFLTLTVCCLLTPVFAQPKTKNVAAPANTNPYQE